VHNGREFCSSYPAILGIIRLSRKGVFFSLVTEKDHKIKGGAGQVHEDKVKDRKKSENQHLHYK